jgi:hypothetical protein
MQCQWRWQYGSEVCGGRGGKVGGGSGGIGSGSGSGSGNGSGGGKGEGERCGIGDDGGGYTGTNTVRTPLPCQCATTDALKFPANALPPTPHHRRQVIVLMSIMTSVLDCHCSYLGTSTQE